MSSWSVPIGILAVVGGLVSPHGLHRLALRIEERGHLDYLRRGPTGSAAGGFVVLQRAVEPQAPHVLRIQDEVPSGERASEGPQDSTVPPGGRSRPRPC